MFEPQAILIHLTAFGVSGAPEMSSLLLICSHCSMLTGYHEVL